MDKFEKDPQTDGNGAIPGLRSKAILTSGQLIIPSRDGLILVPYGTLARMEADGGYTWVHRSDGMKHLVSRSIGYIHQHLPEELFCRCHHKHVINLRMVVQLIRHGGHRLVLATGESVEVARRRWHWVVRCITTT